MTFLIELIREIMLGGVQTVVAFTSWDWIGANPWAKLPGYLGQLLQQVQ